MNREYLTGKLQPLLQKDYSRDAVFRPGSRRPFAIWQDKWLTDMSLDNKELTAWWAANLCHLSYCREDYREEILQGKAEVLQTFRARTQMAFAVKVQNITFLVFQGSTSGEDTLLNLSFFKKRDGSTSVHGGFKGALDFLWPQLEEFLQSVSSENLVVCGHSLGGALAQLSALRFPVQHLYTFGAPRLGGSSYVRCQQVKHQRYVNCCDVVPNLPFNVLGFLHHGDLIFIDNSQKLRRGMSWLKQFNQCALAAFNYTVTLKWASSGAAISRSLTDHAPVNYCRALSRHLLES